MLVIVEKQKEISVHGAEEVNKVLLDAIEDLLGILRRVYRSDVTLRMGGSADAVDAQQFVFLAARATQVGANVLPCTAQDERLRNVWIILRCAGHAAQVKVSVMTSDDAFAQAIESELSDFEDC